MRRILLLLVLAGSFSCSHSKSGWKTVKIGDYLIDIPATFNLKFEKGYDSAPGKIQGKSFNINFDYGLYTDTLNQTVSEYLKLGWWRGDAAIRFMPSTIPYDGDEKHIKVQSIRSSAKPDSILCKGCDYVASCTFKDYHFFLPITLPAEVKNYSVKIDTVDSQIRRLVESKNSLPATVGIYMGDIQRKITSITMYHTIVFEANKLDADQRKLVLKIFATLRHQK